MHVYGGQTTGFSFQTYGSWELSSGPQAACTHTCGVMSLVPQLNIILSYFQRTKQWTFTTQKDIEGDQGTFETIFDSLLNKNSKSVDSFLSWENNAIFPSDVVYISFLEKSQSLGAQLYGESSSHRASIASGEVYDAVSRIINMSEQMAQERSCMHSFLWLQIGPSKRLLSTEPVLWPYPNYVGIKRWYLYSSHDFKGF